MIYGYKTAKLLEKTRDENRQEDRNAAILRTLTTTILLVSALFLFGCSNNYDLMLKQSSTDTANAICNDKVEMYLVETDGSIVLRCKDGREFYIDASKFLSINPNKPKQYYK